MSRRLLILAGITGGLAALSAIDPAPTVAPPLAFQLPAIDAIDHIELRRPHQPPVRLERRADAWFVGDAPVDRHVQSALKTTFARPIPMDARVRDTEPAPYGLTDQALTVDLGAVTIRVGKVVDGRQTFVRSADGAMYRARANLRQVLDRPAHTWPERTIFGKALADVQAMTLTKAGRTQWRVERTETGWRLTPGGDADPEQTEGIAHMLATLRAERFEAPTPFTPRLTVELALGEATHVLEIGPLDGRTAPARVKGQPGAFRIAKSIVELLDVPQAAVLDQRIFRGDVAQVTAVEAGDRRVERSPGWFESVLRLRALSLPRTVPVDTFATPQPALSVHLGADRWTLELGKAYGQGARYARTSDGRVLILGAATLRELTPPVLDEP